MFLPQAICDIVWSGMCYEHVHYYDQFRDEHGCLSEDDEWCLRENAPDGLDFECLVGDIVELSDDCDWVTPSLVL